MTAEETYSGASLDDALSRACGALRARVEELRYEVVSESAGGEVTIAAGLDPLAVLGLFLSEMFRAGGLELKVQLHSGDEAMEGELSGADLRLLTNGGGRGLDALQYLCNRVVGRRLSETPPVHLDSDGFKARRAHQLREQAESAADEALRRERPVVLGPLTPAARREIHLALADDPAVETSSDGQGFLKRVVIRPRRRR